MTATLTTTKLRAVEITLDRAEYDDINHLRTAVVTATPDELDRLPDLNIWLDANRYIHHMRETAPPLGKGYHKMDFTVTYEDGNTYSGTMELTRSGSQSLIEHINAHTMAMADPARWHAVWPSKPESWINANADAFQSFRARYEIGRGQYQRNP